MIICNNINYIIHNILTLTNKFNFLLKSLYNSESVNRGELIILIVENSYAIRIIGTKINLLFFKYNVL